jgi:nucleoside-diphosphate-sugar epimerase
MAMKEHVLVTGGAGMIGSNIVKRLVSDSCEVSVIDNLWRGKIEYLNGEDGTPVIDLDTHFFNADISDYKAIEHLFDGVDYVVHLADIVAGIGYVFNNEGSIFRQNMLINSNIITACRQRRLKGFLYVGTACSFPRHLQMSVDTRPLKEEDQYPAAPESAYGWSKLMGEYEALLMEQETEIPVSILVFHNVYGTPCDFSEEKGQVIPSLVRKAVQYPEEPFIVWGSGAQGRAFVHVDDVVTAIVSAMKNGYGEGIIQIGPDKCTSIKEVAEEIVNISKKDIQIQYDTSKPVGDIGRCADYSKANRIIGWKPRVSLHDGLAELYDWVASRIEVINTSSSLKEK